MRKFEKISLEQFEKVISSNIGSIPNIEEVYNNIVIPQRKTKYSAGYDFHTPIAFSLLPNQGVVLPTGIKVQMEEDEYLSVNIRSSLGIKYMIALLNSVGIVDSDYFDNKSNEGHIMIALWNRHPHNGIGFQAGDAIAQGIFQKYYITDDDNVTSEREGGIGSTGK